MVGPGLSAMPTKSLTGSAVKSSVRAAGRIKSSTVSVASSPSIRARSPPSRASGGPSADLGSSRQSGRPSASTMALNAARAPRAVQCEVVLVKDGSLGARRLDRRAKVDRADAMRREPVEQEVVFGSPAAVLRPVGEIVGIDRRRVRRHGDEKLDAASMKRRVHARDEVDRVGHSVVAHDEPRALLHRLLAEVEKAAVAADQHGIVARAQERLGQILVGPDQNLAKTEVIAEESVDAGRQRQPIGAGRGNRWRWREVPPLLENRRRRVRAHHSQHQGSRQKQEGENREISTMAF